MSIIARAARQSKSAVGRRTFVDGWTNLKKTTSIAASQKLMQDPAKAHLHGADDPTYLKKSGDSTKAMFGAVLFFGSVCAVTRGIWNMSTGTGKL